MIIEQRNGDRMDDLHPLAQVTNIVIAKGGMIYVTKYF